MSVPAPTFSGVCLDYGHGGYDVAADPDGVRSGVFAREHYLMRGTKQYLHTDARPPLFAPEGVINRMSAARLAVLLLGSGFRVWDCVAGRELVEPPTWELLEQRDTPLHERTAYANTMCPDALYLSLHANAVGMSIEGPSQPARGVSFYTSPGETLSDAVASTIHSAFSRNLKGVSDLSVLLGDWRDGDVDYEEDFWVLRGTVSSAVLGEVGFFTNLDDARFLLSERGQRVISLSWFDGVVPWLRPGLRSGLPVVS